MPRTETARGDKTLETVTQSFKTGKEPRQGKGIRFMASSSIPHFKNDLGAKEIKIGVKEFMCRGASDPLDHPHVFLDMGDDEQIICPYCSTLYTRDSKLGAMESEPEGCLAEDDH